MATRIALWDDAPAHALIGGLLAQDEVDIEIERCKPEVCTARVLQDEADLALVPTYLALQGHDGFDALPGMGLSSWQYPFARLVWGGGLQSFPETVAYPRSRLTERFIARVVMHEHYGVDPEFVAIDTDDPAALQQADADAALVVGPQGARHDTGDAFAMDLGREWYELTNYPMVWGLFVMKRGQATTALVEAMIAAGKHAEAHRADWIEQEDPPEALHEFYTDDLRTGIGRLERASLTDFRTYLFYYNVADEIPDMPFVSEDPDSAREEAEDADGSDHDEPENGASGGSTPNSGTPIDLPPPTA